MGTPTLATEGKAREVYLNERQNVGRPAELIDVTLTLDTNPYATGDVLADTQVIPNAVRHEGGLTHLQRIVVIDTDGIGRQFQLLFFDRDVSLGTENQPPDITGEDVLGFLGSLKVWDFWTLGDAKVAEIPLTGLDFKAAEGSRDLYVAACLADITGLGPYPPVTYTADAIKLRLFFTQY